MWVFGIISNTIKHKQKDGCTNYKDLQIYPLQPTNQEKNLVKFNFKLYFTSVFFLNDMGLFH